MLPELNSFWPPLLWQNVYRQYAMYNAWYCGDPLRLAHMYQLEMVNPYDPHSAFWAREMATERATAVHVPIAADLSATSAALLFGEHPKVRIPGAGHMRETGKRAAGKQGSSAGLHGFPPHPDPPPPGGRGLTAADLNAELVAGRMEAILNDGCVYRKLLEAAELGSALKGVFLKVNWDESVADYPILSVAWPNNALPQFNNGVLTACTFWRKMPNNTNSLAIYWLLEHHEPGLIYNWLYLGGPNNIGVSVPLTEHYQTAMLEPVIETGCDGLACVYIPNMLPNRWYNPDLDPPDAMWLGQSDYSGSEGLMDSLDQVYTSLLRDVELGQGRIIGPRDYMIERKDFDGKKRLEFDLQKKVYLGLDMDPTTATASPLTISQFDIRADEHVNIATQLVINIVTNAGYAPQTFGINVEGMAQSGTALNIREHKSSATSAKKAEYWKPELERIFYAMQCVDVKWLGGKYKPVKPIVEMQDSFKTDISQTASAVQMLAQASALSTKTKVTMVHPDWTAAQVASEVEEIAGEQGSS
jgi:hypothetical protein